MIDRALTQGLFYCPKGAYTVWATVFSVAQTVKSVAQTVFLLSATVGFHLRNSPQRRHSVKHSKKYADFRPVKNRKLFCEIAIL